jgi:hypothetical protein
MEKIFGKILITFGILIILAGYIIYKGIKIPIGRLPGDIFIKRDNFVFYFPVVSSILISIILTIIFSLLIRR